MIAVIFFFALDIEWLCVYILVVFVIVTMLIICVNNI